MAQVLIHDLTFAYEGSYVNVFEHISLTLDTCWRLGLVGRNGRGKTTFLRLLAGGLSYRGNIDMPLVPVYFPLNMEDPAGLSIDGIRSIAAHTPEWRLLRELNLLQVDESALYRPYETLSKGEQTKVQLAALFAREDGYPLIDEPTNHLDIQGREAVSGYLRGKDGFLLVSHDRAFLNHCVDHVLSINRKDVTVRKGDYETFRRDMERQNQHERDENQRLQKEIRRLTESARRTAQWSQAVEKSKRGIDRSGGGACDKGYIGARSADMMKRSLHTKQQRERALEEKSSLLKNVEKVGELRLSPLIHHSKTLVEVRDAQVRYGDRVICDRLSLTLRRGERLAITGKNGAGKSSILRSICGLSTALRGDISMAGGLRISYVSQDTDTLRGFLKAYMETWGLDETLFKTVLRNMDFDREQFDKDLRDISEGQKKKILLATSLCQQAHLYVWDEPLNYMDILSRVQVEKLLLDAKPAMLLVEHDRAFLDRVCTGTVELHPVTP